MEDKKDRRLPIVSLDLGIEPIIAKEVVSEKTVEKIQDRLTRAVSEHKITEKVDQQLKQKEEAVNKCYQKLVDAGSEGITVEELLVDYDNLISLIGKIRNIIKKRGDIWKLRKRRKQGKTYYYLLPS